MADVTLRYKGQTIAELNSPGTRKLKTAGKYCEADVELTYIKRCPRADVAAIFDIDAFLASVSMGGTAAEVVETESE